MTVSILGRFGVRFLQARGPADMAQSSAEMGGAPKSLFALAEAHPDLKAK